MALSASMKFGEIHPQYIGKDMFFFSLVLQNNLGKEKKMDVHIICLNFHQLGYFREASKCRKGYPDLLKKYIIDFITFLLKL